MFSLLEISLGLFCTLTFALSYLGRIKFWEAAKVMRKRDILAECLLKGRSQN